MELGVVAVRVSPGSDVGLVLELAEAAERQLEFGVDERITPGAVQAQLAVEVQHVRAPAGDGGVEVAVGAVEVGEHHEPLHARSELHIAEPFGMIEQQRCELDETVADPAVGVGGSELVGLCRTDAALVQRLEQTRNGGDRVGEAGHALGLGVGPVAGRPQVRGDRAVPIVEVRPAAVDLARVWRRARRRACGAPTRSIARGRRAASRCSPRARRPVPRSWVPP